MHHTSGLRDQWGLFVLSGEDFQDHLKQRSILSIARAQTALNFDPGAEYVNQPGVREKLRPSGRRYLVVGPDKVRLSSADSLAARRDVALDSVIEPHEDGVATCLLRAGPGLAFTGPDPSAGGGQYWLVLRGSAVYEGVDYIRNSLAWISCTEKAPAMTAGTGGVEIAVLQFPRALTSRTGYASAA